MAPSPYLESLPFQKTLVIEPWEVLLAIKGATTYIRAYTDTLLREVGKHWNIVYWTDLMPDIIDPLLEKLPPGKVLYRYHCRFVKLCLFRRMTNTWNYCGGWEQILTTLSSSIGMNLTSSTTEISESPYLGMVVGKIINCLSYWVSFTIFWLMTHSWERSFRSSSKISRERSISEERVIIKKILKVFCQERWPSQDKEEEVGTTMVDCLYFYYCQPKYFTIIQQKQHAGIIP